MAAIKLPVERLVVRQQLQSVSTLGEEWPASFVGLEDGDDTDDGACGKLRFGAMAHLKQQFHLGRIESLQHVHGEGGEEHAFIIHGNEGIVHKIAERCDHVSIGSRRYIHAVKEILQGIIVCQRIFFHTMLLLFTLFKQIDEGESVCLPGDDAPEFLHG